MKTALFFLALLAFSAQAQTGPYLQLPAYDFDKDSSPVLAITQEVFEAQPAQYPGIEAKLLAVLENPQATYAAKKFVCEQLRIVGSAACVPPLVNMLGGELTAPLARFALDTLPGTQVDESLLELLSKSTGPSQIALIQTLGGRRCEAAVPPLTKLVASADPILATAALDALSHISGEAAISALKSAKVSEGLEPVRQRALMDAAFVLVESGNASAAAPLFHSQFKSGTSLPAVIAALNGIAACEGARALPILLSALEDPREKLAMAAADTAQRIEGTQVTGGLAAALPGLSPAVQVAMVRTLSLRGDKAASGAVRALLNSPEEAVKAEAALALEGLGDSSVIPELIALASGQGEPAAAAQQSLGRIHASGVNEAMARMLDDPDPKKVRMAALTLKARADRSVLQRLLQMAGSEKADLRNAGLEALDGFAGTSELPALLALLGAAKSQDKLVSVIWKATTALGVEEERFVQLWGDGTRHPKALISLASVAGGAKPLQIAVQSAASSDPALKEAAARSLFAWKTSEAIEPVLHIVKTSAEPKLQILGTRAVVRLIIDRKCHWKQPKKIETLQRLLPLLSRPEDKQMVEAAIAQVESGKK